LILGGDRVPGVDVFVTCCGEPDDVVLDTVKAALNIDWPSNKMRVIVADDGKSAGLKENVLELKEVHSNLHYYSRTKPATGHHGYKAGNLNATLVDYVEHLPTGMNEYIAVFDADMMPEPHILRSLMPYAVRDKRVGMVTAAQVCKPLS
jgi:cellulose synthase/poly-beta-1,6-N-acetylglucosamine synthase-like glycosyltransferase